MTPKKQQALYDAFPDLFRLGINKTGLMRDGLCVGDGWFKLIWELSEAITQECQRLGLEPGKPGYPVAAQVKEKFGALRFYLDVIQPPEPVYSESEIADIRRGSGPGNDKMYLDDKMLAEWRSGLNLETVYDLLREAGKLSEKICERCGAPGEMMTQDGIVMVRCEQCVIEEEKEARRGR